MEKSFKSILMRFWDKIIYSQVCLPLLYFDLFEKIIMFLGFTF